MNNSDETLKKPPENDAVLKAIAELSKTIGEVSNNLKNLSGNFDKLDNRFDNLEKFVTVQFDTAQEENAYNSAKFYRLRAEFYDVCSNISNTRADIKELNQAVRRKEKELV